MNFMCFMQRDKAFSLKFIHIKKRVFFIFIAGFYDKT